MKLLDAGNEVVMYLNSEIFSMKQKSENNWCLTQ